MAQVDAPTAPPRPPQTPEEVAAIEQEWLDNVYQGHRLPELTLQVVVISIALGFLMISFNIYMGLKTGWGEGGSLIAVILGFAIMRSLGRKYSVLENNATQTFASAAGSLGNIVNVIPALYLGLLLFIAGVALAYFAALPVTLEFFQNFLNESLEGQLEINKTMGFVVKMLLAFGAVFELPIVIIARN